jgi:hypothetical protein
MTRNFRAQARRLGWPLETVREFEQLDRAATVDAITDDRITESSVKQHEAAFSIATTQLTGTLLDGTVAETNVTQHEAALSIATTQLAGLLLDATVAESNVTQHEAALSIASTQVTGSLPDASVSESSVTQHEAALSIAQSQITDPFGYYVAAVENTDTTTDLAGTGVTIPLTGGSVHIDAAEYGTSGDGIEVATAGRHRVSAVVDSTGDPITLRFSVNGTATGPVGSGAITAILDLSASDVVTVEASGAVATTTLAASGTSSLSVETWR